MTLALIIIGWLIAGTTTLAVITLGFGLCPGRVSAYGQLLLPWTAGLTAVTGVVASFAGRPTLAIASGLIVLAAGLTIWPKLRRSPAVRHTGAPPLTVVFANLYVENSEPDRTIRQLLERRPDIIVMTELTSDLLQAFDRLADGGYANRVHRKPLRGDYEAGIFLANDLEVEGTEVDESGALRTVEATIRREGRSLLVLAAHPSAPEDRAAFVKWKRQMRALRERMDRTQGAVAVLGDLNSGTLQAPFEALSRGTRFRDAHDEEGTALKPSWGVLPSLPRWVPTLVARLDHLLVTPEIEIRVLHDLDPIGSDHRPFEAELAIGPAPTE